MLSHVAEFCHPSHYIRAHILSHFATGCDTSLKFLLPAKATCSPRAKTCCARVVSRRGSRAANTYIYIYIYRERERDREREIDNGFVSDEPNTCVAVAVLPISVMDYCCLAAKTCCVRVVLRRRSPATHSIES